ncbi:RNA-dependent RNA polymerase [Eimeria tenella RNA virus 1]|uniref:RNA-directed RNA polymerase n=1 Tax=Eimeria tenella RNA virus 1 TaxID=1566868 RepID=A0A0A7DRF5_9VIRU|nr:RNA-dependent RNA polymerase [Eimeria tenella RNA virus 1]AIW58883.1 RNA-dependent RNA polymerase [Eimeria tenella RNA virus 1]
MMVPKEATASHPPGALWGAVSKSGVLSVLGRSFHAAGNMASKFDADVIRSELVSAAQGQPSEDSGYATLVAYNLAYNPYPIHLPLPLSWRSEVIRWLTYYSLITMSSWWVATDVVGFWSSGGFCEIAPADFVERAAPRVNPLEAGVRLESLVKAYRDRASYASRVGPELHRRYIAPDDGGNPFRALQAGSPSRARLQSPRVRPARRKRAQWRCTAFADVIAEITGLVCGQLKTLYSGVREYARSEVYEAVMRCVNRALCHAHLSGGEGSAGGAGPGAMRHQSESGRSVPWRPQAHEAGSSAPWTHRVPESYLAEVAERISPRDVLSELIARDSSIALRQELGRLFPRKRDPQSGRKANIYLDCLLADIRDIDPASHRQLCMMLSAAPPGAIHEDQVCNALIYAYSLWRGREALLGAFCILVNLAEGGERLKHLSDILKASGSNTVFEWAQLCELNCLLGRGVGDTDLWSDAERRTRPEKDMEVELDRRRLSDAINAVLAEELGDEPLHADPIQDYWDRRFEWCVAGSHNHTTNAEGAFADVPATGPGGVRMTRRMAMEHVDENALVTWDGHVQVSVVPKLEQGKTRAIYSCNTVSYAAFGRILRPAENRWAGRRVILDPGAGGNYGMFRRIRKAWPRALGTALMLDYSDFNSQHTLAAQELVVKLLCDRFTNLEPDYSELLVSSLHKMDIYVHGKLVGRARRSLMSDHRGTSFINSVLNAAYIRYVLGEERYRKMQSFHVGDDVLMFCKDSVEAYGVIGAMEDAGFHLQRSKQSVGSKGFEFLRMAGTRSLAHGYVARSIASLVSGNWTTDWTYDPVATMHSFVQQARSLMNRSGNVSAYLLLGRSMQVYTSLPLGVIHEVLSGRVALGAGPVYRADGRYETRAILEVGDYNVREDLPTWRRLPRAATADYFTRGCHAVERLAMELVGFQPWAAALRASYGALAVRRLQEGLACRDPAADIPTSVTLGCKQLYCKAGAVDLDSELDRPTRRGALVQYPVIALLQNTLTDGQIGELLRYLGVPFQAGQERITAFGNPSVGVVIQGDLPYSDASALCSKGILQTVRVIYPLRM